MKSGKHQLSALALGITSAVSSCTLLAEEQMEGIERIEVTSEKRHHFIRDISASVSALTEKEISGSGIDNLADIASRVTGMSLSQPVKNRSTINIRGINTDIGETQLTQDPVGLYLNEMPVTGTYAEILQPDLSLFDIDRVEVQRGPQGTLYGSGNIGGAVHLITNQPQFNEFDSALRFDFGSTDSGGNRQRFDGMLNLPVVDDTLAMRFVVSVRDEEGWVNNLTTNTRNDFKDTQFRGLVRWAPTQDLSLTLNILDAESEPDDIARWSEDLGQFNRAAPINEARSFDMTVTNLQIEYDINDQIQLVSSTNSRESDANWWGYIAVFDGLGDFVNQSRIETDGFSQEFRLVGETGRSLDWVVGAYYFNSEFEGPLVFNVLGLQDFVNSIIPDALASDLFFGGIMAYEVDEKAIFGDATYALTDQWSISAGLRYFETETVFAQFDQQAFDFDLFGIIDLPDVNNEVDESDMMWRAVLTYEADSDHLYYLNVSKGVRAGQTNPNYGPSFADPDDVFIEQGYQSDSLYSTELGAKLTMLDGNLQANIALYHIDWQDTQVDALRLSDQSNYIANAGDAVSQGLEIEIQAVLGESTQGYISAAWQDAEIDDISAEQSLLSGAVEGDPLPGTADFMLNVGISSEWALHNNMRLQARLDGSYKDDSVNRFSNLSGIPAPNPDFATNESYTLVNGSLSLVMDNWRLTLYGENLTNNDNVILNVGQSMPNPLISLRPRTVGMKVDVSL